MLTREQIAEQIAKLPLEEQGQAAGIALQLMGERPVLNEAQLNQVARKAIFESDEVEVFPEFPAEPLYIRAGDDWHLSRAYDQLTAEAWVRSEILKCRDLIYCATHYFYAKNDYLEDEIGRASETEVIPDWDFVRAVLGAFAHPQDVIIEKSRDMMLSWLSMATVLHDLLFRHNWAVMTLSRVENLVDDGGETATADSLHGKVLYMYRELPPFLFNASHLQFRHLQIRNRRLKSHATGFSATPSAGRGPKWKRAILDEFAWVPFSEQVMTSVVRACPRGKALISTPHGKANAFYRIRKSARGIWPEKEDKKAHWLRLTVHWSQHPMRTPAWYERETQTESMTEDQIAQELDISYVKSLGKRVYPKFNYEKHVSEQLYDPRRPLFLTCDFNYDPLIWEVVQMYSGSPKWRVVDEICKRNAVVEDAIYEFIFRYGHKEVVDKLMAENSDFADMYGSGGLCLAGPEGHKQPVYLYGDATEERSSVHTKVKTYQRIRELLAKSRFFIINRVPMSNPPRAFRIGNVNTALMVDDIAVDPRCEQLTKDLESGTWDVMQVDMDQRKIDDDGSGLTRSHASSAFGYLISALHKMAGDAARGKTVPQDPVSQLVRGGGWRMKVNKGRGK